MISCRTGQSNGTACVFHARAGQVCLAAIRKCNDIGRTLPSTSPQVHMSRNLRPLSSLGHRLSEAQENSTKRQKNVCTQEQRCSTKGQANFSTRQKKEEQRDVVKLLYVQALPDIQNFNVFFCCHQLRTGVYDRGSPSTVKSCLTGYHESIHIH